MAEHKHYISPAEMEALARSTRFWQRLAEGLLRSHVVARARASNPRFSGAESRHTNYYNQETGRFVATVHRIVMPDGTVVHEHLTTLVSEGVKHIRR